MKVFVDANVFVRFFTRDDQRQHEKAERLLQQAAAGRVRLVSGPPVLFETAWTLRSAYKVSPAKVLEVVEAIAGFPGLSLTDADLVTEALSLARASGVEFADAYIAASAQAVGADGVATFNIKDFDRMDIATHPL